MRVQQQISPLLLILLLFVLLMALPGGAPFGF